MTKEQRKFDEKELKHSKRIFKSATPKYTKDWYIKWVASIFVLTAMSMRGLDGFALADVSLSCIGVGLWLWVAIIWNDRALIILNGAGLILLLRNLMSII
jgi:hypothetical protein